MREVLPNLIIIAGVGQLSVLVASALVPLRLNWRTQFAVLPRLHRQMVWVYAGYVVLSIVAFSLICLFNAAELASGTRLARSVCAYMAVFWGIRLSLQAVLDVKEHLTAWWLYAGEIVLTILFVSFTTIFGLAAVWPTS
ncbi:MAG: hypothetical protein WD669_13640 [Pirellulales bacterium]